MRTHLPTLRLVVCLTLPVAVVLLWWASTRFPLDLVAALISVTGYVALAALVASLAVTPLVRSARATTLAVWRKPLGIAAGVYAVGHALVYLGLDYAWAWGFIWANISSKRHLVVAVGSLVLLVPLLVTSTRGWQRRLGPRWKQLHTAVYPASILAGLHYLWLVKSDIRLPVVVLVVIGVLLLARLTRNVFLA